MSPGLLELRGCFDGGVPSMIATCSREGVPNVSYVSQVHYVDAQHVALSFQFFNKTRTNMLANPRATVFVIDPDTLARYRLALLYLRTEDSGPLFESMRAKLAGIAAHTCMSEIFHLRGADLFRVLAVEPVPGRQRPPAPRGPAPLAALRPLASQLAGCSELDALFEVLLDGLGTYFGVHHAMLLLLDRGGQRLYTVASRGYAASGIGSEIPLGNGIVGIAAQQATPIRINYMNTEYAYGRTVHAELAAGAELETLIPLPGLPAPHSQLAVPIPGGDAPLGVLYLESPHDARFGHDEEDAFVALAAQLGAGIRLLTLNADCSEPQPPPAPPPIPAGRPLRVRHYCSNDSVFLDEAYLIKGVAGSILWRLLELHQREGRREFSNRELRLDPAIRLPGLADNLEARLILLERRLRERDAGLWLEKTGRGRFRLCLAHPLELLEMPATR
ncbi:GAF domain-containing protein [Plasticicumulans acidivorans]|uniref:Pyridoxamine 5'-phosphate oxidase n=1 Tax=Plasticicumulans acidivorans TaxID=886464 RepID=A0A317MU03_9GAMM|nr:GAF domain-containing protein [Plasticicumulans acidivorans]PWV61124.1 pyridoxamine 5'-phosphate oxidase [Plasticicumulans acidivorans]